MFSVLLQCGDPCQEFELSESGIGESSQDLGTLHFQSRELSPNPHTGSPKPQSWHKAPCCLTDDICQCSQVVLLHSIRVLFGTRLRLSISSTRLFSGRSMPFSR
eukprot:TRINITY_DN8595_c0_g1_i2.p1 TRINITY_DN8595_c0_g1~~TRINITY_DN8595_c0_g1_i2.p1  ORF type:complete len:104 (+),score=0.30 TRINITY_DN8595_c0_g1_i2:33-344(+)